MRELHILAGLRRLHTQASVLTKAEVGAPTRDTSKGDKKARPPIPVAIVNSLSRVEIHSLRNERRSE